MEKRKQRIAALLILAALLSGCGKTNKSEPTKEPVTTGVSQTSEAPITTKVAVETTEAVPTTTAVETTEAVPTTTEVVVETTQEPAPTINLDELEVKTFTVTYDNGRVETYSMGVGDPTTSLVSKFEFIQSYDFIRTPLNMSKIGSADGKYLQNRVDFVGLGEDEGSKGYCVTLDAVSADGEVTERVAIIYTFISKDGRDVTFSQTLTESGKRPMIGYHSDSDPNGYMIRSVDVAEPELRYFGTESYVTPDEYYTLENPKVRRKIL